MKLDRPKNLINLILMPDTVEIKFITNYGIVVHEMPQFIFTDPATGKPYKFAKVHGKTWQITFMDEIEDETEAFTPCPAEFNHRGIYEWSSVDQAYKLH